MSHITTCTTCGELYEESSEEQANAPTRECRTCYLEGIRMITEYETDLQTDLEEVRI